MVLKKFKSKIDKSGEEGFSVVGMDKDLDFRKKPYGHKPYKRKTKTGKIVNVKGKGVKPTAPQAFRSARQIALPPLSGSKPVINKEAYGMKQSFPWVLNPAMNEHMIVNKQNPLRSADRYDANHKVNKISINMKTHEFVFSTSPQDNHAKIQSMYGSEKADPKAWLRGIYDAKNNVLGIRVPDIMGANDLMNERVLENVGEKAFNQQCDVFEALSKSDPSLKMVFNLKNTDLDKIETFDAGQMGDKKRILLPKDVLNNREKEATAILNSVTLGITPNRKEDRNEAITRVPDAIPLFREEMFTSWKQDLFDLTRKLNVNIDDLWESIGRWEEDVEPSYVVNLSDSKKNIFKVGCELGKRYRQHSVMFVKANPEEANKVVEIDIKPNSDLDSVHDILSNCGLMGSSITLKGSRLIVGITSEEENRNVGKALVNLESDGLMKDYTFYNAEVDFVDEVDYDNYINVKEGDLNG